MQNTFIRAKDLAKKLGISQATVWRYANGTSVKDFPKPIRIGANVTVWKIEEIDQWVNARANA